MGVLVSQWGFFHDRIVNIPGGSLDPFKCFPLLLSFIKQQAISQNGWCETCSDLFPITFLAHFFSWDITFGDKLCLTEHNKVRIIVNGFCLVSLNNWKESHLHWLQSKKKWHRLNFRQRMPHHVTCWFRWGRIVQHSRPQDMRRWVDCLYFHSNYR